MVAGLRGTRARVNFPPPHPPPPQDCVKVSVGPNVAKVMERVHKYRAPRAETLGWSRNFGMDRPRRRQARRDLLVGGTGGARVLSNSPQTAYPQDCVKVTLVPNSDKVDVRVHKPRAPREETRDEGFAGGRRRESASAWQFHPKLPNPKTEAMRTFDYAIFNQRLIVWAESENDAHCPLLNSHSVKFIGDTW